MICTDRACFGLTRFPDSHWMCHRMARLVLPICWVRWQGICGRLIALNKKLPVFVSETGAGRKTLEITADSSTQKKPAIDSAGLL